MEENGLDHKMAMSRAKEAIALSLVATETDIHRENLKFSKDSRRFYEIVGFDILFDKNVRTCLPPHARSS